VFHCVDAYQRTSAAKTSLAVDGDSAWVPLGKVFLARTNKLVHNFLRWDRSVHENHVFVVNAILQEGLPLVLGFVKSNNFSHLQVIEYSNVAWATVAISTLCAFFFVDRPHECHKLAWNYPIQVAVLHPFVVFILLNVECLVIIPSTFDCEFKSLKAVLHSTIVEALPLACVSITFQQTVVRSE